MSAKKTKSEEVTVRYTAQYTGESPILRRVVKPGEEIKIDRKTAKLLVSSGQFEIVAEKKPAGGETDG